MGLIAVCLDCPEYIKGGYCNKKRKDVGALQPACPEVIDLINNNEEDMETTPKPAQETKHCPKRGRDLPRDAYNKRTLSPDGLQPWCRECTNESARQSMAKKAQARKEERPKPARPAQTAAPVPTQAPLPKLADALDAGDKLELLDNFDSKTLVAELRARGFEVICTRPVTVIEEL